MNSFFSFKKYNKSLRYVGALMGVLAISWLIPVTATDTFPDVPPYPLPISILEIIDTDTTSSTSSDDVSDYQGETESLYTLPPSEYLTPPAPDEPMQKLIALTFDDGPSEFTEGILDQLDAYGGRGTFFVIGRRLNRYAHLLQRMADTGHEIGNHTWAHERLPQHSPEHVHRTIQRTSERVYEITGIWPATFRPPYMAFGTRTQGLIEELGYPIVLWSVDPRDWDNRDADMIYEHIMAHTGHGDIVLLHDIYDTTYEATLRAISSLAAQGFHFVTVSELLGGELSAGGVYHRLPSANTH